MCTVCYHLCKTEKKTEGRMGKLLYVLWKDLFICKDLFFIFFEILNHVNVLPIINKIFAIIKIICSTVNILIRQTYDARVYIIKVLLDIQNLGC